MFEATSHRTEPYTTILAQNLSLIKRLMTDDEHGQDVWPTHVGPPVHANVDRATLRQILLTGLDDRVHYGKTLERYESKEGGVVAYFSDGTTSAGHVLVGADGIRSAVRQQRAPHCDTIDAGVTAIYGRIPTAEVGSLLPHEALEDIFTVAYDDRKVFLGLGAVCFPLKPQEAVEKFAPGVAMRPQDDYVVCIVGGRHEFFPKDLRKAAGPELQQVAAKMLEAWPDRAASVVRAGDPTAFFLVEMYTSVPCVLNTPINVTLLGDAIHAMTPTLGRGANVAMRDGALLGRELKRVADGSIALDDALGSYERQMLEYGFAVVREAAQIGQERMAQNPLPA